MEEFFEFFEFCKGRGLNTFSITLSGFSFIGSFIALTYNHFSVVVQQEQIENWIVIAERLGVPFILLLGLLFSFWKLISSVAPFIIKQVEDLISIPKEQLELERIERKEQQDRWDELHKEDLERMNRQEKLLIDTISSLTILTGRVEDLIDIMKNTYSEK